MVMLQGQTPANTTGPDNSANPPPPPPPPPATGAATNNLITIKLPEIYTISFKHIQNNRVYYLCPDGSWLSDPDIEQNYDSRKIFDRESKEKARTGNNQRYGAAEYSTKLWASWYYHLIYFNFDKNLAYQKFFNIGNIFDQLDSGDEILEKLQNGQRYSLDDSTFKPFIGPSKTIKPAINLANGNFILEKYIRDSQGIVRKIDDIIANIQNSKYGLRLSYLMPVNQETESIITSLNISDSDFRDKTYKDKSFRIYEGKNIDINGERKNNNLEAQKKKFFIVPLIKKEIDYSPDTPGWNSQKENLLNMLKQSDEFKFLFDYCFPLKTMFSIELIYVILYLFGSKKIKNLLKSSKSSARTVFNSLLNGSDYTYEDPDLRSVGGNVGLSSLANIDQSASGETDGIDIAGLIAKAPLYILKGLAELIDPSIKTVKRTVDEARSRGEDVNFAEKVFTPYDKFPMDLLPPILGGIGPPITPIGLAYLGLDIDGILNGPASKQKNLDNITPTQGTYVSGSC